MRQKVAHELIQLINKKTKHAALSGGCLISLFYDNNRKFRDIDFVSLIPHDNYFVNMLNSMSTENVDIISIQKRTKHLLIVHIVYKGEPFELSLNTWSLPNKCSTCYIDEILTLTPEYLYYKYKDTLNTDLSKKIRDKMSKDLITLKENLYDSNF